MPMHTALQHTQITGIPSQTPITDISSPMETRSSPRNRTCNTYPAPTPATPSSSSSGESASTLTKDSGSMEQEGTDGDANDDEECDSKKEAVIAPPDHLHSDQAGRFAFGRRKLGSPDLPCPFKPLGYNADKAMNEDDDEDDDIYNQVDGINEDDDAELIPTDSDPYRTFLQSYGRNSDIDALLKDSLDGFGTADLVSWELHLKHRNHDTPPELDDSKPFESLWHNHSPPPCVPPPTPVTATRTYPFDQVVWNEKCPDFASYAPWELADMEAFNHPFSSDALSDCSGYRSDSEATLDLHQPYTQTKCLKDIMLRPQDEGPLRVPSLGPPRGTFVIDKSRICALPKKDSFDIEVIEPKRKMQRFKKSNITAVLCQSSAQGIADDEEELLIADTRFSTRHNTLDSRASINIPAQISRLSLPDFVPANHIFLKGLKVNEPHSDQESDDLSGAFEISDLVHLDEDSSDSDGEAQCLKLHQQPMMSPTSPSPQRPQGQRKRKLDEPVDVPTRPCTRARH